MDFSEIISKIETWDKDQITEALALLKKDKTNEAEVLSRYQYLLDSIDGKTLKSLADFPKKWDKLSSERKAEAIKNYQTGTFFPVKILNLNGNLRVDAWRDSHYSHQIGEVPAQIGLLKEVTELHLQHQQLEEFPEAITDMQNLEVLNLRDNEIRLIPESLLNLKKLRILILEQNYGLKSIPNLSLLPDLEEVDFTYTDIDSLPEDFYKLKKIKKITTTQSDLDRNLEIIRKLIKSFPDAEIITNSRKAIEKEDNKDENEFKGLEKISISEFNLNYLPETLFAADQVKELKIRCWNLLGLADEFDKLQTLEILDLETGNDTGAFPASIFRLKNLKQLRIKGNFTELPDNIDDLKSLESLEMKVSSLKELPPSFSKLKHLKTLKMEYCSVDVLSILNNLESLETLTLEGYTQPFNISKPLTIHLKEFSLKINNQITDEIYNLPKSITKLELTDDTWKEKLTKLSFAKLVNHFNKLEKLMVRDVDFSDLSEEIKVNHSLREILIYYPKLTHLPDSISNLHALKDVTLFGCTLEALNPALYDCPELEYFRISNSNFKTLPEGISRMQKIKYLGFESGKLESVPGEIMEVKTLTKISLEGCPLFKDKDFKTLIKKKIKGIKITKGWYE